ncbi:Two-component response regulator, YesN/AraC family, consists of REC and AraC-type DNA-binding domains [Paenibacillus sp. cl141a]|uniref:response regulator n=1 Tax=Paenibacillus sp. cl141a TaxID=1761877 RepID=UPI0008BC5D61|nr:response regulator [Paenibacillus sp. cl141a]SEM32872.1 Two-component response regulator, YesN/AraC family, consists of REC and AraC-type DNA-binding domains [Paenibacillus sp. cl141a]
MYNILVVDDEPLICKGLAGLLTSSGLAIDDITTAYSGQEALDYIRMGDIDLLVTDIQMGEMNGIELMQQAKIVKPWVQTIIISAHETFQYAQRALQLGAKDYLIKPLNSEQFLDSVRSVLLKMDRPAPQVEPFLMADNEHFRMEEPPSERIERLNERLAREPDPSAAVGPDESELGLVGPYFAVIKMKLGLAEERSASFSSHDIHLIQYAALNIAKELLEQEPHTLVFYSPERDVNIILQWSEQEMEENASGKIHHLEMIGRSLHHHVELHLKRSCTVGISQILRGREFLSVLSRQADKAMLWSEQLHDFHVFYYGDFNWHNYAQETSQEVLSSQSNRIVENTRQYIDEHYRQKGLTIHDVAKNNHVSPNYLSYLFKKYTGSSLWEYVVKLRMEESRALILNTDLRRYEIAERVGYESPEHFSKIFKKYYGVSPSELKK